MRRKIVFLLVLTVLCSCIVGYSGANAQTVAQGATFQRVDFVNGTVTTDSLNVRQGPGTNKPIVCVLKKGATVKIFGKIGDWYAVYVPDKGCVGAVAGYLIKPAGTTATPGKTTVSSPKPSYAAPKASPTKTVPKASPSMTVPKTSAKPSPVSSVPPTGITSEEQKLLDLVNSARSKEGLGALQFDMTLVKVARLKAQDMVDKNYFSHESPTYGSPFDMMRQFNVEFRYAGENIAGNQTVEGAFKAWMNSPGHKANILNANFNYNGIGIVDSPTYGKILVQQFIGR